MDHPCCASVPMKTNFYRPRPCKFKACVERNGKWYCKRHDPVASEAKRQANFDAKQKLSHAKHLAKIKLQKDRNERKT